MKNEKKHLVIGLTGGIASGKSTVTRFLKETGARVIDADKLGHKVYEPGQPGHGQVLGAFGSDLLADDGRIDRRALGAKVFGSETRMRQLTDIVWPQIRNLALEQIESIRLEDPKAVIVLEAAVLLEASWQDLVDEVWVVRVDPKSAIKRLCQRNGFSREEAQARLDSQMTNDEREAYADRVIDNSRTVDDLRLLVRKHWAALQV